MAESNYKGRAPSRIPHIGERFGLLVVASEAVVERSRRRMWCDCDCGQRVFVQMNGLLSGNSTSCGCSRKQRLLARNSAHGANARGKRTPEYNAWALMKNRCNSPSSTGYADYGGRGIRVCERWSNSFAAFLADMGPKPGPDYSIDRIDVNGDYEPGNCRWATDSEQANNTRRNRRMTHDGITLTMTEWAKRIGISVSALHGRLGRMAQGRALSMPPQACCVARKHKE